MYIPYLDKFRNMDPYLHIDAKEWSYIKTTFNKEDIVETLSNILMSYELPYADITIDDAQKDFMRLKGVRWHELLVEANWKARDTYKSTRRYHGKSLYLRRLNVGNSSSNYFQQVNRWQVDATQSPGPARCWITEKSMKSIVSSFFTLKYELIDKSKVRVSITLRKYICSQFRPSIAKSIYEMFNAETVLDFSAGWGDRLSGFFAASTTDTYIGIDPRTENHPIYRNQIEFYSRNLGWFEPKKTVYVYDSPAEDWDNSEWIGKVDLIFTSPPYFNTERYSNDDKQSWVRYKNIDSWNTNFLHKSLDNVWQTLKPGGVMLINIANIYDRNVHGYLDICDPMIEYMNTKSDCTYEGAIGMEMAARPGANGVAASDDVFCEPCWIFKKQLTSET